MKKIDVKSAIIGLVIGIIGVSAVFAVVEKKSAVINEKKLLLLQKKRKQIQLRKRIRLFLQKKG
jgi:hypothetical protein